tara:strand:+ start:2703 stop:3161 length:459 start_codon:yes stop_codon:yes gene_type:complete
LVEIPKITLAKPKMISIEVAITVEIENTFKAFGRMLFLKLVRTKIEITINTISIDLSTCFKPALILLLVRALIRIMEKNKTGKRKVKEPKENFLYLFLYRIYREYIKPNIIDKFPILVPNGIAAAINKIGKQVSLLFNKFLILALNINFSGN